MHKVCDSLWCLFYVQGNYMLRERTDKSMIRFKRGLAILLSACMIGGMMPLSVSAEEAETAIGQDDTN